ncbi:MAG: glycerol-3-phosphate dehydrogenase subunit GlpB [Caldilineaceae bacterium]
MLDLVIIGAGPAGLSAAYHAAKAGMSVHVIAKGQGTTHWQPGTVDVLGYSPIDRAPVDAPFAILDAVAAACPDHPYAWLGADRLRAALDSFVQLTQEIGLPYRGAADGANLHLPSPAGAARPVFLAPEGQLAGQLDSDQPMVIVGFERLRDFYPKLIAENLRKQGHAARSAFLPMSLITRRKDFTNVQLAQMLEDDAVLARLGDALHGLVKDGERIGFPAILGLDEHNRVYTQLRRAAGAPLFEIPTLPPSVPGIRLYTALRRRLIDMGVRIDIGMEVIGFHADGDRVAWVETETSARPLKHRAKRFLLATGGILGGGIDSDHTGRVWETIFDLPVTSPQDRAAWFRPRFLDKTGQPVFRGGVPTDGNQRPQRSDGHPFFQNLWVVGGALAGADPILERSLEGIAIATGMAAVEGMMNEG